MTRYVFTIEGYAEILRICKEEKTIKDLTDHFGFSATSAYNHVTYLVSKHKLKRIVKKGSNKAYFQTVSDVKQFKEQLKAETEIRKEQRRREYEHQAIANHGKKHSINDKGVVEQPRKGVTVVNGMNGYHPTRVERTRPRVYVGSTANML